MDCIRIHPHQEMGSDNHPFLLTGKVMIHCGLLQRSMLLSGFDTKMMIRQAQTKFPVWVISKQPRASSCKARSMCNKKCYFRAYIFQKSY